MHLLVDKMRLMLAGISILLALSNEQAAASCRVTYLKNGVEVESDVLPTGTQTSVNCTVAQTANFSSWAFGDVDSLLSTQLNCSDSATYATMPGSGVLVICNPSISEAGDYFVQYTVPGEPRPIPVTISLYSAPKFDISPSNQEATFESAAKLSCTVTGEPLPDVVWMQSGMEVNDSRRVVTTRLTTRNRSSSILDIIRTTYADRSLGPFTCVATSYRPNDGSAIGNVTSSGALVRVRDPLAALWPALGLIAQIVILALIMLYTNYKKKEKAANGTEVVFTKDNSSSGTDGAVHISDRSRRLSEQYRGDVPLLTRANSSGPPHGYSV